MYFCQMRKFVPFAFSIISTVLIIPVSAQINGSGFVDFEGSFYPSVIIGTQEWSAKNLSTVHFRNGDSIPLLTGEIWSLPMGWGASQPQCCNYINDANFDTLYGKLYNWYTVNDSRGVCPAGWRVPSNNDWDILNTFLGPDSAGLKMRDACCSFTVGYCDYAWWSEMCYNSPTPNSSGFSAKPGSWCGFGGGWGGNYPAGAAGVWWSSTEIDSILADFRTISRQLDPNKLSSDFLGDYSRNKKNGFSVRCMREANVTGLFSTGKDKIMLIYPNPSNVDFSIDFRQFNSLLGSRINIINSFGQIIYSTLVTQQSLRIDLLRNASSGLYIIQLVDAHNKILEIQKILVQ